MALKPKHANDIGFPCCQEKDTCLELADEIVINAPKDQVYAAYNDPEVISTGGAAGHAKDGANVTLTVGGDKTILRHEPK